MIERLHGNGFLLAVCANLVLASCSQPVNPKPHLPEPVAKPPAPQSTIADEFITTFWCGPPLDSFDDDRAREIAEAGFNLVGATCEGPVTPRLNNRALRIAARNGLKMLIKDTRVTAATPLPDGWQARANKALAAYRKHDSLAGIFLLDEPSNSAIYPDIAALRRRIRNQAPGRIGYVNLLPDYVFPGPEDYREYAESYVFQTRPDLLSYDHYPFLIDGDRPSFFENLGVFRELSLEYDVPFMLIVQLMPHADYREIGDAEVAWQVFHALAFGARGISYFAYWTPTQVRDNLPYRFRKGIIEGGLRTEHYRRVAELNPRIRAVAGELAGFRSTAVWDSLSEFGAAAAPGVINAVGTGSIVAGEFEHPDGRTAVLLVNRDYRRTTTVALQPGGELDVFDDRLLVWTKTAPALPLRPGEGRLVRRR